MEALFVYGTLMREGGAHHLLKGARFLGEGRTGPGYTLLDCGAWPALVERGHRAIWGEVYLVDAACFPALDAYEDAPELYQRVQRPVAPFGEVWVYLAPVDRAPWPSIERDRWKQP
ncbi:MAG: gamma-glutamylcyclotransferase family protein [Myxococcota bacterium]